MTYNKANPVIGTDTPDSVRTYLIGDDVIAQTVDGVTDYLLYDGHGSAGLTTGGSTRQLVDSSGSIVDTFSYDAYGVLLQNDSVASADPGKVAQQSTNLLYTGEHFDVDAQQYYLRARYYDPLNGRFNRTDPFAGSPQDPQSLHKYLYCHNNPVNNIDPSGQFSIPSLMTTISNIGTLISISMPVIAPVLTDFASFFIPQWLETAMTGEWPSAGLIGGSLAITGGSGIGLGGIGGGEILYALRTQKFVAYAYTGFTGGFMSGRGIGVTGTGYLGAVWGIRTSKDYTGRFYSISIPFGHFGSKLRKSVAEKITAGVMYVFGAPPKYRLINEANIAAARRISGSIGPRGNFLATIFWNNSGTVGGISLGASLAIGRGLRLSTARTWYQQRIPQPIGDDVRIPF